MEFHFRRHFRLRPKMKNAFRSASSIHHKKVLVLNTRLGLEIKVLVLISVLKKILITSLEWPWKAGREVRFFRRIAVISTLVLYELYTTNKSGKVTRRGGRGAFLRVSHAIAYCTNASRGLSEIPEFLVAFPEGINIVAAHQSGVNTRRRRAKVRTDGLVSGSER